MTSGPGLVTLPPRPAAFAERVSRALHKAITPPSRSGVLYLPVTAPTKPVRPLLRNETFEPHTRMHEVRFSGADLERCSFRDVTLVNSSFAGTNVRYCDFRGATLAHVDFRDAIFEGTQFGGVDLSRADFRGADLRRVPDLTAVQIAQARIDDTTKLPGSIAARLTARTAGPVLDLRSPAPSPTESFGLA